MSWVSAGAPGTTGHCRCTGSAGSLRERVSTVQLGATADAVATGDADVGRGSGASDGRGPSAQPDSARASASPSPARDRVLTAGGRRHP